LTLLLLLQTELEDVATAPVETSRVGAFGLPEVDYSTDEIAGAVAGTLPAITASLTGTHALSFFGTIGGTLPAVTASIAATTSPAPTGTIAGSLAAVTAALSGTIIQPVTGSVAGSLPAVTAALAGLVISDGFIAATLPAVTAALDGTHTPPAVSGTMAGTLPRIIAALEGSGGRGSDVAFPEKVYKAKKRREAQRLAEKAALNKRIRQKLGLEPPDPEPDLAVPEAPSPGPFFVAPDLASVPLRAELAALQGRLSQHEAAQLKAQNEEAFKAILAADDGTPGLGLDPSMLEEAMVRLRANGQSVTAFAQEVQALAGQAEEANSQTNQLLEQFQAAQQQIADQVAQTAQVQAQTTEALGQLGQVLMQMLEGQNQLTAAVKAPRKKKLTVTRGPDNRVLGADVIEEGE
jgi:hypothetical protein